MTYKNLRIPFSPIVKELVLFSEAHPEATQAQWREHCRRKWMPTRFERFADWLKRQIKRL